MKWRKTGRAVKGNGETTVYYESDDGQLRIESRKRQIPHSNRSGHWMFTSYFLIHEGSEKEYHSLKDAKEAAEEMRRES